MLLAITVCQALSEVFYTCTDISAHAPHQQLYEGGGTPKAHEYVRECVCECVCNSPQLTLVELHFTPDSLAPSPCFEPRCDLQMVTEKNHRPTVSSSQLLLPPQRQPLVAASVLPESVSKYQYLKRRSWGITSHGLTYK